jgi:hypothetical protein
MSIKSMSKTTSSQVPTQLIVGRKYYPVNKTNGACGRGRSNRLSDSGLWSKAVKSNKSYLFFLGTSDGNHSFSNEFSDRINGDFFSRKDVYEIFEVGDKVKLDPRTDHSISDMNPTHIYGTIANVNLMALNDNRDLSKFIYDVKWDNGKSNTYHIDDLIIAVRVDVAAKKTRKKPTEKGYTVSAEFIKEGYKSATGALKAKIKAQFPELCEPEIFEFKGGKLSANSSGYIDSPIMIAFGVAPEGLENRSFIVSNHWELKSRIHNGRTLYYFQEKA